MTSFAAVRHWMRGLALRWRGSLPLRVALTTISLSIVVAVAVASVALTQVRDGLISQRERASLSQASTGLEAALRVTDSLPAAVTAADRSAMVDAVVASVASLSGSSGDFEVLLLASEDLSGSGAPERSTNQISDATVNASMRSTVTSQQAQVWQITTLRFLDGHSLTGIAVGAPLYLPGIGQYELYQLFPLDREVSTLTLIRNSIGVAGLLLVIGMFLISAFLTRQLVRPVRLVAESAKRLRDGRLSERLAVRGTDDLGQLARSFNAMANSLQEQIRRLENASAVQQRFVSDVSHELRTPLTTIRMASELLYAAQDDFDPASARAVQLLQQQSERFELLLNDLLEISRLDAGTVKLEIDEVELGSLIARVVDSLALSARDLNVKVKTFISPAAGTIHGDARRLDRIVRNLLANAIEHAQGQRIDIIAHGDEFGVAICVRDYGSGLNPGESSLVFNRFWRSDPSRQRTLGGTGLGLSISLEDAQVHGAGSTAMVRRAEVPISGCPCRVASMMSMAIHVFRWGWTRLTSGWRTNDETIVADFPGAIALCLRNCAEQFPLHVVKDALPQGSGDSVRVIARPPTVGMSPTQLVSGFIAANASSDEDYGIARKYLAPDYENAWAPQTVTVIDASQLQYADSSASTVTFAFPVLGVLSAQKRLDWLDSPSADNAVFSTAKVNGEWRIIGAPSTVFLSATDFTRNFRSSSAYFFASDFSSLVPDPVWLPIGSRTAATRMMRVLLDGPAGPLAASTQSSFQPGMALAIAAVTVANGTASVAFDATPLQMNASQRRLLLAQVVYSLTDVDGVQLVRVTAEGQALPGNDKLYLRRSDFSEFSADVETIKDPFFSVHNSVLTRGLTEPVDIGTVGNVQSVAVSADGVSVATVAAGIAKVARITDVAAVQVLGRDFESVQFDSQGALC